LKINWNPKYTLIAIYSCAVTAIIVICVFIGVNFSGIFAHTKRFFTFISPITYGFIIAYLINPVMKFCENKLFGFVSKKKPHKKLQRALAMISAYLIFAVSITLFILLIVPQVITSYYDLQSKMSGYVSSAQKWVTDLITSTENSDGLSSYILSYIDFDAIIESVNDLISNSYKIIQEITPYILDYIGGIINQLKNALLGIIFSAYFLAGKEKLAAQIKKMLYAIFSKVNVKKILGFASYTDNTFGGFIVGKIVDSIIIGILTFIVLAICKMPYYPLISLIIGVTNVIPFFGPFIGAIPSIFFIFIADPMKAFWFALIILIIQQIDGNIIGPKILGVSTGLDSLGVIVAITVMSGIFGIPGMFFGVPLFAMILYCIDLLVRRGLEKRELPVETEAYMISSDKSGSDGTEDGSK